MLRTVLPFGYAMVVKAQMACDADDDSLRRSWAEIARRSSMLFLRMLYRLCFNVKRGA